LCNIAGARAGYDTYTFYVSRDDGENHGAEDEKSYRERVGRERLLDKSFNSLG
jgi:hypothetical protein